MYLRRIEENALELLIEKNIPFGALLRKERTVTRFGLQRSLRNAGRAKE